MRTSDWSSDVCSSDLTEPVDAAIAILRQREAGVASFNQTEPDIAAFMTRPWVVTSSDASRGHPRYYASYARKYATSVKDKRVHDPTGRDAWRETECQYVSISVVAVSFKKKKKR